MKHSVLFCFASESPLPVSGGGYLSVAKKPPVEAVRAWNLTRSSSNTLTPGPNQME